METEERGFLRDQVARLNAELQRYQEKYMPLDETEQAKLHTPGDPPAPWLTSKELLSPLIAEYDNQLTTLRKQNNTYKIEHLDFASKINKLVTENNRLHRDLQASVEGQLEVVHEISRAETSVVEEHQLIENLQGQIAFLTQEKDSAVEMWQETVNELDRLTEEHRALLNSSETQAHRLQSIQEKDSDLMSENHALTSGYKKLEMASQHLHQVVASQSQELDSLRDHLKRARTDARSASLQLADMKAANEQLKHDTLTKEREKQQAKGREDSADTRLGQLQAVIMDLEHRLTSLSEENGRLLVTRKEQEEGMTTLRTKCCKSERREHEALAQVRDSIQMVENALLEKDQALIREQQKTQELGRLQGTLSKLINKAGKRTRQEVDNVKTQCNTNLAKLMEEIQSLEMESAEKHAEVERAVREKRAVEQELEMVYKEGAQGPDNHLYQELQGRVSASDRTRAEALVRVQKLENTMQRMENSHEEEKLQISLINTQLRQRLDKVAAECEATSEERLRLTETVDEHKKQLLAAQKERAGAERKCLAMMAVARQEMSLLKVGHEAKLESIEHGGRQAMKELRDMLTAQQRMSAKWREESNTLAQKFESKANNLRSELSRHKQQSEELAVQLSRQKDVYQECEQRRAEEALTVGKLNRKLTETQHRAAAATKKLTDQLSREKKLLNEKKQLQNELERVKLEMSRSSRSLDPIRLSDLDTRPDVGDPVDRLLLHPNGRPNGQYDNGGRGPGGTGSHASSVRSLSIKSGGSSTGESAHDYYN